MKILLLCIIIAIYGCDLNSDDANTKYYSKWETCTVEDINGNVVTIECDTILREASMPYDSDLKLGDVVEVRTDYEEYTEIQE